MGNKMGTGRESFKKELLELYKKNLRVLLLTKTEPYSIARFKKKKRIKELYLKIMELEKE